MIGTDQRISVILLLGGTGVSGENAAVRLGDIKCHLLMPRIEPWPHWSESKVLITKPAIQMKVYILFLICIKASKDSFIGKALWFGIPAHLFAVNKHLTVSLLGSVLDPLTPDDPNGNMLFHKHTLSYFFI